MRINNITKLSGVILAFFFAQIFFVGVNPAWGSCRISNISLKKEGDFTKVTVYADKPFEFSHSTEEAKHGKPYRVIIDCKDAIFDLPQNNFKKGLPPGMIQGIRTSQFQVVPERMVRVVLDLKGSVVYKVTAPETEYEASIAILSTQDPGFPMWVAVLEEEKDQKISRKKKQTEATATEAATPKDLKSDQSQSFLPGAEGSTDLTVSTKREIDASQKGRVYRRAVCYADTGEHVVSVEEKPVLSFEAQSKAKRIEKSKTPGDISSTTEELVLKSTSQAKVEEKEMSSVSSLTSPKQTSSKPYSPKRQISRSPVPLGPFPEDYASLEKKKRVKAEKKEDVAAEVLGSIGKGIGKILGPEPAAARQTEALAESSISIQTPYESKLDLLPQRKMVYYNPVTRRDPFMPITEKQDMSFGEVPLPLFENIELVGILKDKEGNRALLEDKMGFGYILMSGDRIKNGYVIRVEDERAVFHVEEYGGYQTMVLELNSEY